MPEHAADDAEELSSSDRFEAVLRSISDGVFTVDSAFRIRCFNRAAQEITGFTAEEALGRPCHEVFRINICPDACALRYTLETGERVVDLAATLRARDEREVPVSVSTSVLRDRRGRVMGGVETFRDLTLIERLRREVDRRYSVEDIIGKSPRMRALFDILGPVARGNSPVLLQGESGTGKELFARAIHRLSDRSDGPFVAVNCGALPEALVESELFGYRKGAFTGATRDKPGRVAVAEGGTLLLDEVGDLPPPTQVKLLRFLQELEYEPVGGVRPRKADVRIVAATHVPLAEMVRDGLFRDDLYYRLNVMQLDIPPLRQRTEDIPLLIDHFIARFNAIKDRHITGLSAKAMDLLLRHDYPGNVRELENIIEHGFVLCAGSTILSRHLPVDRLSEGPPDGPPSPATSLQDAERAAILRALEVHGNNRLETARALGIHKTTLFRKIKRLGIELPPTDGRSSRRR